MKTQESAENYLETILMLGQDGRRVRSIDIVNRLDYAKPSVSVAMKHLRAAGRIETDAEGYITLTGSGRKIAETMYERHMMISDWLISLGVGKETAVNDACRMEHVMSEESFLAVKGHIEEGKKYAE